jgi:hypothetical protein
MATKIEKEPTLTPDFLIKHAQDAFEKSKSWREEEIVPRWKKSNDLYNAVFDVKERSKSDVLKSQGRLFVPKTYSHLQRILVDIMETFFFDPEEIVNITAWKSIPAETRLIVKAILNYRLNGHPINFYQEAFEACLDALKNKVGILKVYPETNLKKPVDGESWRPIIEAVPYEDVFFDAEATWKDYYKFPITHRMRRSLDYLKKRGYKNLELLESATHMDPTGGDEIKEQRSEDQGSPFNANTDSTPLNEGVFVYETWTFLDVDGDGLLESCSYLSGGDAQGPKVLIRDVEKNDLPYDNDRAPFVVGSAFPEPHKMYGKDLPEVVEDLQKEINAIRNQNREAVAIGIRKPLLVNRGANVDLMSLVNRRIGGVVMGDDISPSSIRELETGGLTAGSIQEQARNDADFFEATSQSPTQFGVSTPGEESATENSNIQANANKKVSMIIANLAQTMFIPAFNMLLQLEQKHETDSFIEKVTGRMLGMAFEKTGDEGAEDVEVIKGFPKKIIQGDFELSANTGVSKQQQLNKFFLLIDRGNMVNQTTAQMVQTGVIDPTKAEYFDLMAMFRRILPIVGEKNVDDFVLPAQAPPPPPSGEGPGIPSQRAPAASEGNLMAEIMNRNPEGGA